VAEEAMIRDKAMEKREKIIRTPTHAEGGIAPDEERRMREHAQLWIAKAFRTDPIEPDKIVPAIEELYAAAGLPAPRVVIAPSPLVMAFAYGASAAIWYRRKYRHTGASATDSATIAATRDTTSDATLKATRDATRDATYSATDSATYRATYSATLNATNDATYDATYSATFDATLDATDKSTRDAIDSATLNASATASATDSATRNAAIATYNATYSATDSATASATRDATYRAARDATDIATSDTTYSAIDKATVGAARACFDLGGALGISCARHWFSAHQGGNMWVGWDCYLTAARDILGLRLPEHAKYAAWERAAIHGGFRLLHEEFCIVCDFPETIEIDRENRPHCETRPSHRWRDGWSLYHWHGVRIPGWWIERKDKLTPQAALTWKNLEQRRAACEIIGWDRILTELNAETIDKDVDPQIGELVEINLPDNGPQRFLRVLCATGRTFALPVPTTMQTALEANAATWGLPSHMYKPEIRT
jgi:hypothetical protein